MKGGYMNKSVKDFEIFGITGYTVMCTYHLKDSRLSLKAKGLLSIMLSLPKEWDYSINGLTVISGEGRASIKTILKKLKEAEYIKIDKLRNELGHWTYKYSVYYLPFSKWIKMQNLPVVDLPPLVERTTVEPEVVNQQQLKIDISKNNNKKDKIDKYQDLTISNDINNHNIVTKELIKKDYISFDDSSSFLFDDLFNQLIEEGHDYKSLLIITNYIISKIKSNDFKDESGNEIKNKYGYFKNALFSNINKFKNMPDEIYSEERLEEI